MSQYKTIDGKLFVQVDPSVLIDEQQYNGQPKAKKKKPKKPVQKWSKYEVYGAIGLICLIIIIWAGAIIHHQLSEPKAPEMVKKVNTKTK